MLPSSQASSAWILPSPHLSLMTVMPPVVPNVVAFAAATAVLVPPPAPPSGASWGRSLVWELHANEASAMRPVSLEEKKRMWVDMVLCESPLGSTPTQGLRAIFSKKARQWRGKIAGT